MTQEDQEKLQVVLGDIARCANTPGGWMGFRQSSCLTLLMAWADRNTLIVSLGEKLAVCAELLGRRAELPGGMSRDELRAALDDLAECWRDSSYDMQGSCLDEDGNPCEWTRFGHGDNCPKHGTPGVPIPNPADVLAAALLGLGEPERKERAS